MVIINAVAHNLKKTAKAVGALADPSDVVMDQTPALNSLVSALLETFNRKTAQRTGVFENDEVQYPFGNELNQYLEGNTSFIDFTSVALRRLGFLINDIYQAEGGYILFVHYETGGKYFLTVAKLTNVEGKMFSEDRKSVLTNFHLSLDRLHHVGRINLTGWEANASTYVTFVNAREGGGSSDYFVKFLGCSTATQPKIETKKLVAVVEQFCTSKNMTEEQTIAFKAKVYTHAKELPRGAPISLKALANVVSENEPEDFIAFVNGKEEAPSDEFYVDKTSLKPLIGYSVKVPGLRMWMTVEFKNKHRVRFTDNNELIIADAGDLRGELE